MAKFTDSPQQVSMEDVDRQIMTRIKSTSFWREAPPRSIDPASLSSSKLRVIAQPGAASNFTVSTTSHLQLQGVNGYMDVSGQMDVRMDVSCIAQPPTGSQIFVTVLVDGAPVIDRIAGASAPSAQFITLSGHYTAAAGEIPAGRRLFSVGAYVNGGTGTVFCGDTNAVRLDVREVY